MVTQLLGLASIFVMYASSPDYLLVLTISVVFALMHVLTASMFLRMAPRWCALFIAPISAGVGIALVLNAGRFISVFSKVISELVS